MSATRDLSPNSDKLPLFSAHQDLDGIKFKEVCSRSLQLAAGNSVSLGIFRLSGRNLVPSHSLHAVPDQNCLPKYILVKQIKRDRCLSHLLPFFYVSVG